MTNEADYIIGDDMVSLLTSQGGSEAATYALSDDSMDATRARFAELIIDRDIPGVERDCLVPVILLMSCDVRNLIAAGLIYDRGRSADYMYLTDDGAAFARSVR